MLKLLTYIVIGVSFLISLLLLTRDSLVIDEFEHVGAGYAYIVHKDYTVNTLHPPLIKWLAGIGVISLIGEGFPESLCCPTRRARGYATSIFIESGIDPKAVLVAARIPVLLFNYALLVTLALLMHRQCKPILAFGTFSLFCLNPLFLGHSHLVTMDVAVTLASSISLLYAIRYLKTSKYSALFLTMIFGGLSIFTKLNGLFVFAYLLILSAGLCISSKNDFLRQNASRLFWTTVLAAFSIFFLYGLTMQPLGDGLFNARASQLIGVSVSYRPELTTFLHNWYVRPFVWSLITLHGLYLHVFDGTEHISYFMGMFVRDGNWYYFPLIFLLKQDLITVSIFFFGLVIAPFKFLLSSAPKPFGEYSGELKESQSTLIILVFALLYTVICCFSDLGLGVRYLLPAFPPLIYCAAYGVQSLIQRPVHQLYLFCALSFLLLVSTAARFPTYLSYYNILAGGSEGGHEWSIDSDSDWGHDLLRLKLLITELNLIPIYTDLVSPVPLANYLPEAERKWGIERGPPPSGQYFAVSTGRLQMHKAKSLASNQGVWFDGLQPVMKAGKSIQIYKSP